MTETLDRPVDSAADLDVLPAAGRIGAEIRGVDVSKPLTPETVETIRRALDTWKVVFFRGQNLDHASQVAFGRQFGELTYAHPHDDCAPRRRRRHGRRLRFELGCISHHDGQCRGRLDHPHPGGDGAQRRRPGTVRPDPVLRLRGGNRHYVQINFVQFGSGPLVDAGFAAHSIDVGFMGDLPAALAVPSGLPVKAVAAEEGVGPEYFLIAKPGITSIAQLEGKSVAYTTLGGHRDSGGEAVPPAAPHRQGAGDQPDSEPSQL